MSIIRKLNKLGKAVYKKYPYINCGGCCVYAALVAEALLLHKISCKGFVSAYSAGRNANINIDKARENIRRNVLHEWQGVGISFNHVGLEFEHKDKLRHYDVTGVARAKKSFDFTPIYEGRLNTVELQKLAACKAGWNDSFNRRHIPSIRKMVQEHLAIDN